MLAVFFQHIKMTRQQQGLLFGIGEFQNYIVLYLKHLVLIF